MNSLNELQNYLSSEAEAFLKGHQVLVALKEIKKGIEPFLLKEISQSSFFSAKSKPGKMSESREREWAEGRRLELAVEAAYKKSNSVEQWILLSSISHCSQVAVPLVVCFSCLEPKGNPRLQGIGIDIESGTRKISKEVSERFLKSKNFKYNLPDIELWVLKEAAFKATPQDLQLVVSEYQLSKWDDEIKEGVMVSRSALCHVKLLKHSGFVVGLSYFRL